MEPESSFPCLPKPITDPFPATDESSSHPRWLQSKEIKLILNNRHLAISIILSSE
jgi:hypothetical protein